MAAIGETLRQARLRLGVDLNQVAQRTKISLRFLQAIEADDFGKLPGGVFARMFVKQYADELGLDGASLAEELQQSENLVQEPPDLQTIVEARSSFQPKVPSFDSVGDRVRSERLNSMLSSLIWVVAAVLVCSGAYYGINHWPKHFPMFGSKTATAEQTQSQPSEVPKAEPQPSAPPTTEASAAPQTATPPAETPTANPVEAPAARPPTATADQPAPAPSTGAAMELSVVATDTVWLSATADGKNVFSGILEAGNSKIITASAKAKLNIGNAGALIVTCNGKKYDPFGPVGQVRIVEFTPEGAQVVSRTPPPNPDPLR